jgi:hypothetical protein
VDRAEQISIGPWTISARRSPGRALSIEVLLGDVPHAKIELEEDGMAGEPRPSNLERQSKLEADMDY